MRNTTIYMIKKFYINSIYQNATDTDSCHDRHFSTKTSFLYVL
jgi:hypothetical protein